MTIPFMPLVHPGLAAFFIDRRKYGGYPEPF